MPNACLVGVAEVAARAMLEQLRRVAGIRELDDLGRETVMRRAESLAGRMKKHIKAGSFKDVPEGEMAAIMKKENEHIQKILSEEISNFKKQINGYIAARDLSQRVNHYKDAVALTREYGSRIEKYKSASEIHVNKIFEDEFAAEAATELARNDGQRNVAAAYKLFNEMASSPDGGISYIQSLTKGSKEEAAHLLDQAARFDESPPKLPELFTLQKIMKRVNDKVVNFMDNMSPTYRGRPDKFGPLQVDPAKILRNFESADDFAEAFRHSAIFDFERMLGPAAAKDIKKVNKFLKNYYNRLGPDKIANVSRAPKDPLSHIKKDQIQFRDVNGDGGRQSYLKWRELVGDDSRPLFAEGFRHTLAQARKAAMNDFMGTDPEEFFSMYTKGLLDANPKFLDNAEALASIKKETTALRRRYVKEYDIKTKADETTERISKTGHDLVSGMKVVYSAVRNVAFDNTAVAGYINAQRNNTNTLGEIFKAYWQMGKGLAGRGKVSDARKMFEDMGVLHRYSAQRTIMGAEGIEGIKMRDNNFIDDVVKKSLRQEDWKEKMLTSAEGFSGYLASRMGKISAADLSLQVAHDAQVINLNRLFLDEITNTKWDGLTDQFRYRMSRQGIKQGEYEAYTELFSSNMPKVKTPEGDLLIPDMRLSPEQMRKYISQGAIDKIKRPLESDDDVVRRLQVTWSGLLREELDKVVAMPQRHHTLVGDETHPLTRHLTRFANITNSQWQNALTATRMASGGADAAGGSFGIGLSAMGRMLKENPKQASMLMLKGAMVALTFGGAGLQLMEIARGREPKDMSNPEFWFEAAMFTGTLGGLGYMINNMIFNDAPLGMPAFDVAGDVGKALFSAAKWGTGTAFDAEWAKMSDADKRNALKVMKESIPYLNVWWMRNIANAAGQEMFNIPDSPYERRRQREAGRLLTSGRQRSWAEEVVDKSNESFSKMIGGR